MSMADMNGYDRYIIDARRLDIAPGIGKSARKIRQNFFLKSISVADADQKKNLKTFFERSINYH